MKIKITNKNAGKTLTVDAEGGFAVGTLYGGTTFWDWDDRLARWIERGTGRRWLGVTTG